MASTTVSAGKKTDAVGGHPKARIWKSIVRLNDWLKKNDYRGYDTFDGLSAKFLRPFTFETKYLRIVLQQTVRRFPLNSRPIQGISKSRSTKGMGYLARGYMRLQDATGDKSWGERAESALQGSSRTNLRVRTQALAGAMISTTYREAFISPWAFSRSFGPRSRVTPSWTPAAVLGTKSISRSRLVPANTFCIDLKDFPRMLFASATSPSG